MGINKEELNLLASVVLPTKDARVLKNALVDYLCEMSCESSYSNGTLEIDDVRQELESTIKSLRELDSMLKNIRRPYSYDVFGSSEKWCAEIYQTSVTGVTKTIKTSRSYRTREGAENFADNYLTLTLPAKLASKAAK
jgi:hypothetical protein